jgi:PQQ-dependent dehydrogenase (methanol/ethanol family)
LLIDDIVRVGTLLQFAKTALRCGAVIALSAGNAHLAAAAEVDGATAYREHCANCHASDLTGAAGPALSGFVFADRWAGKKADLYELISKTMPLDAPGTLSAADIRSITDYIVRYDKLEDAPVNSSKLARSIVLPAAPKRFATATSAEPDDDELKNPSSGDWLYANLSLTGQRYSPLRQITPQNVGHLAPKCIFQTGEIGSFQSSPIVRQGRLYITTAHRTYAVEASNCRKLWSYEYTPTGTEFLPTNRGVALYKGMVIRGTLDGHLIALDALNGKLLWDLWVCDSSKGCFISAAPVIFDGKLYIGEAGADFGAVERVHAFDAATLEHLWSFDTVPSPNEAGGGTWPADADRRGGSVWTTITIERSSRRLFVSLGNPGPDLDGRARAGDNLYTDSVVVLDADSGHLIWYAQQNAHDVHDWDTAAAPVIYDQKGRALMAVGSKDGHLYLYDRTQHGLIAREEVSRQLNVEQPFSTTSGTRFCPGTMGGVEWNGPAYDPNDQLLFVNSVDWCTTVTMLEKPSAAVPWGASALMDPVDQARGSLRAFDAASGRPRWSYSSDSPMLAGLTPTASGLLLTGSGGGEMLVFDSKTGRRLYSFYTGGAVAGGVSTYSVGNKQFIAVESGNASKTVWQNTGSAEVIIFGLPD